MEIEIESTLLTNELSCLLLNASSFALHASTDLAA